MYLYGINYLPLFTMRYTINKEEWRTNLAAKFFKIEGWVQKLHPMFCE